MKSSKAFSLIELLVVIAIIAVLVSIMLPVVGRIRASAYQVRGLTNLRQWVVAFTMYADDNRGRFPAGGEGGTGVDMNNASAWFNALPPYVGEIQLRYTPNAANHTNPGYGAYPRPGHRSIHMCPAMRMSDLASPPGNNQPVFAYGYNQWIEQDGSTLRWQDIEKEAARFAVFGERGAGPGNPSSSSSATMDAQHVTYRHMRGRNTLVAFADGHASVFQEEAFASGVVWNPDNL